MNRRMVIKSKFRFTVFLIILMIAAVTMLNTVLGFNISNGNTEKNYIQVEISSGDTLWDIASTYAGDEVDTRDAIHQICTINDINAGDLVDGMIIDVPEDFN